MTTVYQDEAMTTVYQEEAMTKGYQEEEAMTTGYQEESSIQDIASVCLASAFQALADDREM